MTGSQKPRTPLSPLSFFCKAVPFLLPPFSRCCILKRGTDRKRRRKRRGRKEGLEFPQPRLEWDLQHIRSKQMHPKTGIENQNEILSKTGNLIWTFVESRAAAPQVLITRQERKRREGRATKRVFGLTCSIGGTKRRRRRTISLAIKRWKSRVPNRYRRLPPIIAESRRR